MPLKAPARESHTTGSGTAAVDVAALTKTFQTRSGPVTALDRVTFSAAPGETLGIVGPSG